RRTGHGQVLGDRLHGPSLPVVHPCSVVGGIEAWIASHDASVARLCTRLASCCTRVPPWPPDQLIAEELTVPDDRPVPLSGTTRADHLERLRSATADSPLDVLVVGGGVNGAGAAFDAASRGLNVGLVEASDWASGTSSRSSKLMHGGLRYLQMLDFTLVAEAQREPHRLRTRTAPHPVLPISFVFPFCRHAVDRAFIGSGVALYDAMQTVGRKRAVPFHRHLSRRRMLERFRGLDGDKAVGA